MLPLRWLSPEALSLGKFTIYSDIFSFGVTMWEIFTYGMQPFYGRDNNEVSHYIITKLKPSFSFFHGSNIFNHFDFGIVIYTLRERVKVLF